MGELQPKEFYDAVYKVSKRYSERYRDTRDFPLFAWVRQRIERSGKYPIVELGCGTGQLAHYLYDENLRDYVGIDFSGEALRIAQDFSRQEFIEGDIFEQLPRVINGRGLHREEKIIFVILEVLEHIEEDVELLKKLPAGSIVMLSVPSFDHEGHVRYFENAGEIYDRYGSILDFRDGTMIDKHFVFATNRRNGEVRKRTCSEQKNQFSS